MSCIDDHAADSKRRNSLARKNTSNNDASAHCVTNGSNRLFTCSAGVPAHAAPRKTPWAAAAPSICPHANGPTRTHRLDCYDWGPTTRGTSCPMPCPLHISFSCRATEGFLPPTVHWSEVSWSNMLTAHPQRGNMQKRHEQHAKMTQG